MEKWNHENFSFEISWPLAFLRSSLFRGEPFYLVRVPDTYRVSPSNTSLFGDLIDFLSFEMAGVTSSAPEYFKLTIGAIGSPSRSPPLNKLPKLKIETLINLPNHKGESKFQFHKTLLVELVFLLFLILILISKCKTL